MKQIIIKLDSSWTDTLQYHHQYVKLVSVISKGALQYPIEYDGGCMRFTLKSGYQTVKVIIDINDLCARVVRALAHALVDTNMSRHTPVQEAILMQLSCTAHKLSLGDVHLYWFEWNNSCSLSRIEEMQRLHHLERHSDTLHTCMYVMSVLNDVYKLQWHACCYAEIDYPSLAKSALPVDLARYLIEMNDLPADEQKSESSAPSTTVVRWVREYLSLSSISYKHYICGEYEFTLSHQREHQLSNSAMAGYLIIRELVSMLCAMPFDYDFESRSITR